MLKPYIGFEGFPEDGAILVFAHNLSEAKKIGWPVHRGWNIGSDYIDFRVNLLKGEHYYKLGDKAKLDADLPHVIDDPTSCKVCEYWGIPLNENGVCEECIEGVK